MSDTSSSEYSFQVLPAETLEADGREAQGSPAPGGSRVANAGYLEAARRHRRRPGSGASDATSGGTNGGEARVRYGAIPEESRHSGSRASKLTSWQTACAWCVGVVVAGVVVLYICHAVLAHHKEVEELRMQNDLQARANQYKLEKLRMQTDLQARDKEDAREEEQARKEQQAYTLSEPGRQLKQENAEIVKKSNTNTGALRQLDPNKLTIYSQAVVLNAPKQLVGYRIAKHLDKSPPAVIERVSQIVQDVDTELVMWDRVYDTDDSTGSGYYSDVKIRVNVSGDRVAVAARIAGTKFSRREAVIGYKEEKEPVMATRRVRASLMTPANCGIMTQSGTQCLFPFRYDGLSFSDCTNYGSTGSTSYRWCATAKDASGIKQAWDYCTNQQYHKDCTKESERYGAIFAYVDEPYVIDYKTKQVPIIDSRVLPKGVSHEEVINELVFQAAGELTM